MGEVLTHVLAVAAVVLAVVVVLAALAFWVRLRALGRRVGSFECALRTQTGWAGGIAHYGVSTLRWYRIVSLAPRPAREFPRTDLDVLERAVRPTPDGAASGILEVTCRTASEEYVLAMSTASYAGLASWLESSPPRERTL
ncbi:DUF2550 domain-containing protein [Miniimonas sp. S16]|uniref:DUF2550 domain-containing protein n=1 Tax=Miniimonas sp. S16 TaxID=2171623 RepID=UPI000D5294A8|nr:DUF2550 domain-containing protein [Miniimonas sp. S16]